MRTLNQFVSLILVIALSACGVLPANQEKTLRVGPGGKTGIILHQEFQTAIPTGTPVVPGHGKEVGMAYGALSGVNGVSANGVAAVHYLEDKTSIAGFQLNIKAAPEGMFYEGWLESEAGEKMSVGHLSNPFNDVRHSVRLQAQNDLQGYLKVHITLEADDGDPEPGEIVASGTLKQTCR